MDNNNQYKLKIISSTVRQEIKAPLFTTWIAGALKKHGCFYVEVLKLGNIHLPLINKLHHPIHKKYKYKHTKQCSSTIEDPDNFLRVTKKYNYNYPTPLRNALEYLYHAWIYKAVEIEGYGGVSATTRGAYSLKSYFQLLRTCIHMKGCMCLPLISTSTNISNL